LASISPLTLCADCAYGDFLDSATCTTLSYMRHLSVQLELLVSVQLELLVLSIAAVTAAEGHRCLVSHSVILLYIRCNGHANRAEVDCNLKL